MYSDTEQWLFSNWKMITVPITYKYPTVPKQKIGITFEFGEYDIKTKNKRYH